MATERETIVTDRGISGGGIAVALVAVAAIILLALWLSNGLRTPVGNTIDLDVPAVTVTPDGE